jgi:hypothetical protein
MSSRITDDEFSLERAAEKEAARHGLKVKDLKGRRCSRLATQVRYRLAARALEAGWTYRRIGKWFRVARNTVCEGVGRLR